MNESMPAGTIASPLHPVALPSREWQGVPLPNPGTSFVGRERQIRALSDLLVRQDVRLVTLTGPGGVGKSRLSLQVARRSAEAFPDGVVFVDLAPNPDLIDVAAIVADAMGIRGVAGVSIADRLAVAIHDRALLLVLDGFDLHIAQATLLADLLGRCERCTLLVTSREPLRLSTEWVRVVTPLTLPSDTAGVEAADNEAVTLFAERARAVAPDFVVDERTSGDVAAIVRALDGLPLAIELAAARLAHLTPQALLQRLDRRMTLLTGGALDLPERHQTLRRSIAWSHDLLSTDEQLAFRRLSVFVRGFTLAAASQVMALATHESVDHLDLVGALVARSLIRCVESCDGEPRFDMLDTLREFAAEQLEAAGEVTVVRDRHAAWFVTLAERADASIWGGPNHVLWLDRLHADLDNSRAALSWLESQGEAEGLMRLAAALGGLWAFRSLQVEGRRWLRRALELDDGSNLPARAMVGVKLAMLERQLGGGDTLDLAMMALDLRRQVGDRQAIGRALLNLGYALRYRQEHEGAIEAFRQGEAILGEIQDLDGLAMAMQGLAALGLDNGDLSLAEAYAADALALNRQTGFAFGEARASLVLGWVAMARQDVARAARLYAQSLALWLQVRSLDGLIDTLAAVAALAVDQARPGLAATLIGAADSLCTAIGYVPPQPWWSAWDRVEQQARVQLEETTYDTVWHAGCLMGQEEAVAAAAEWLNDVARTGTSPSRGLFTPRERDVLRLLVEGRSDREIALALDLKYRTVTSHVRNILDKLDVSSRTAAATRAVREGLL